jgi:hypothetical protein
MPELDRREFLKVVGASAGAAATVGCSDPVDKLIPYLIQPEEITPGLPLYYASTCLECPVGCGLHVKTREGRPIKLEGNPEHPVNRARCAPAVRPGSAAPTIPTASRARCAAGTTARWRRSPGTRRSRCSPPR